MKKIDVRIVKLEPLRAASIYGFGPSPESVAWEKLEDWAKPKGFLKEPHSHRIFGFNNPNPSAGSPNYGYELWIEVGPEVEPEGDIRIIDFPGGLYAVTRCEVRTGHLEDINNTWKELVAWSEDSPHTLAYQQCLEESVFDEVPGTEFILDLYLPIVE